MPARQNRGPSADIHFRLPISGRVVEAAVSPDDGRIAVLMYVDRTPSASGEKDSGISEVWVCSPTGGNPQKVAEAEDGPFEAGIESLQWRPHARQVSFASHGRLNVAPAP